MATKLKFIYGQYTAEQACALAVNGCVVFSGVTKAIYVDGQPYGGDYQALLNKIGDLDDLHESITATNLVASINNLDDKVDDLIGGMRYNGGISTAVATWNTTTNDVRPGDIYTATSDFTIGTKTVETGDMVIYNGPKTAKGESTAAGVDLTESNCTIIERETENMVTAENPLALNQFVLGSTESGRGVQTTGLTLETNQFTLLSKSSTKIPTTDSVYQTIKGLTAFQADSNTFSTLVSSSNESGVTTYTIGNSIGTFKTGHGNVMDETSTAYVNGLATVKDVQDYIEERFTWASYEVSADAVASNINSITGTEVETTVNSNNEISNPLLITNKISQ